MIRMYMFSVNSTPEYNIILNYNCEENTVIFGTNSLNTYVPLRQMHTDGKYKVNSSPLLEE